MSDGIPRQSGLDHLNGPPGLGPWLRSRDHRRIGLMFMGWTVGALLTAGLFGILLAVKSLGGYGAQTLPAYQAMTYQRLLLVFMVLVPAIPGGLGHFLLPGRIGAADLALPGFSAWSLRLYAGGVVLVLVSVLFGPVATGWLLPTPLSLTGGGLFAVLAAGLACQGLSWFLMGVNFIATVHARRAPGLGFFAMPVLAWSLYLAAYLLAGAGLVFAIVVAYLATSRATGGGLFGAGSDPLLWLRYFWAAVHPALWAATIAALGVVTDVAAGGARKAVAGYRLLVGALIALAALSVTTWGGRLAGWGQDPASTFVFGVLSLAAAIPLALVVYSWLATLHRGASAWSAASAAVLAFLWNGGVAAALGLVLASPAPGAYLGTTTFASAHLDYLAWGAVLASFLAGLQYWWPEISGRTPNQQVGVFGILLYFLGVNLAFFPQVILGMRGAPLDLGALEPGPGILSETAGLGWLFLIFGAGVVLGNLLAVFWAGEPARRQEA